MFLISSQSLAKNLHVKKEGYSVGRCNFFLTSSELWKGVNMGTRQPTPRVIIVINVLSRD
jgi:hypothetical protein